MNDQDSYRIDLCIIGAGAAGLSIAAGAVQLGLDVALIESGKMGGECLNTGCIPSKSLLACAKAAQNFRDADQYGICAQEPKIDHSDIHTYIHKVIRRIEPHDSVDRFEGLGVKVIKGHARFISKHELNVETEDKKIIPVKADNFIIATGTRPFIPEISGIEHDKIFTNENIFNNSKKIEELIIIGGGPIGLEMAQAHQRLGSKVTLITDKTILQNDDPELVNIVREKLTAEGVRIFENTDINTIIHNDKNSVSLTVDHDGYDKNIRGTHLLIATGRTPNLQSLNLDKANIKHDGKGIITDTRLRTNHTHIWAAGDIVSGSPKFTHIASQHAGIIIRNICFKQPAKINYDALPWVTYTDPEIAHVGLTIAQANEKFGESKIQIQSNKFRYNDRALTESKENGILKLITHKNGKILGISIAGENAGELLAPWILAITKNMKIKDLTGLIIPYPTYSEIHKRTAGNYYTKKLFSPLTQGLVNLLQKLPF